MKTLKGFSIHIAATLIFLRLGTGYAHAAQKVTWDEFQDRFGGQIASPQGIEVLTQDGRKHRAEMLQIVTSGLRLYGTDNKIEALPRNTVKRVKIRSRRRYKHYIKKNVDRTILPVALLACWESCDPGLVVLLSIFTAPYTVPMAAYTVASTPVFLALDAMSYLIPSKAYEIVP